MAPKISFRAWPGPDIINESELFSSLGCPIDLALDDGFKKKTEHMLSRAVLGGGGSGDLTFDLTLKMTEVLS